MPTQFVPETVTPAGVAPTFTAAAVGDEVRTGAGVMLVVKNAAGVDRNVTVPAITPCDQGVLHNAGMTVPAGAERKLGR